MWWWFIACSRLHEVMIEQTHAKYAAVQRSCVVRRPMCSSVRYKACLSTVAAELECVVDVCGVVLTDFSLFSLGLRSFRLKCECRTINLSAAYHITLLVVVTCVLCLLVGSRDDDDDDSCCIAHACDRCKTKQALSLAYLAVLCSALCARVCMYHLTGAC
jgi:hypothetical protein